MKKVHVYAICVFVMLALCSTQLYAQRYVNYGSNSSQRGYNSQRGSNSYGGYNQRSRQVSYPMEVNLFGVMGGVFLTSNPDLTGYDVKKNYVDGGGGFVYNYRYDISEANSLEVISSLLLASCSTSRTEEGESKMKVTLPVEGRWYIGHESFKVYIGGGLQYNFIWSMKKGESNSYYGYYDDREGSMSTGAHQLSGNGMVGFCILGMKSPVHFLLGTKFHFPIVNNAEGVEYSQSGRIDFSKDKTCVAATGSVSVNCGEKCVLMLNYDYPLGSNKQTEINGNFFQMHSQSITMSLLWAL